MQSIRNWVQLTPDIATSGQPDVSQFSGIATAGYEVVINLAMPDHPESISNEGEIVTQLGMSYLHIPVPFDAPKPVHVKDFCSYMKSHETRKVFVHCIMNYRVSAFMFHYLHKVAGFDEASSKSRIFEQWQPDETWQQVLSWSEKDIGLST